MLLLLPILKGPITPNPMEGVPPPSRAILIGEGSRAVVCLDNVYWLESAATWGT
jgi:hypothetical protein